MTLKLQAVLISLLLLVGCSKDSADQASDKAQNPTPVAETSTKKAVPTNALADTRWQLVEFQSMDDATGTQRPENPEKYTLYLNADGTAQMQLNCNRANGTWSNAPATDGQSGAFSFGQMAVTSALCPPPSMDEQIAAQTQYISGYLLKDGNLYLSLMADGGIYVWEPS